MNICHKQLVKKLDFYLIGLYFLLIFLLILLFYFLIVSDDLLDTMIRIQPSGTSIPPGILERSLGSIKLQFPTPTLLELIKR